MNELKEKIKDLKRDIQAVDQQGMRVESQKLLLTKYSNGLFAAGGETTTSDLLDHKTIGMMINNLWICYYCIHRN